VTCKGVVVSSEIGAHDLSSIPDYNRLPRALSDASQEFGGANQAYEELGRQGLTEILVQASPHGYDVLRQTIGELKEGLGALILLGSGVEKLEDQTAQLLSITLASVYGEPTRTDRKLSQIAWPVRYDPDATVVRTFSQALGEAAYHTDTQYFEKPEDYFALFCIESDTPGKGTNRLIHVDNIISALDDGRHDHTLDALSRPYPFRVPSVFTRSGEDSDVEVVWAPIINRGDRTIRYRKATIASALKIPDIELADGQHQALQELEATLVSLEPIEHHLQPGEAVLVNNKKLLHSRTAFDDPHRFLYRVRMNEKA
jgi:alpha-ketoglutarate-dependent taurine dioxygenase